MTERVTIQTGVFPSLLKPAHLAVQKMLREKTSSCELEGKKGFRVAPAGQVDEASVYFNFTYEGANFVIFEAEEIK